MSQFCLRLITRLSVSSRNSSKNFSDFISLNTLAGEIKMNEMLKWRLIVEIASKPASAQFIQRICADTPENRKHLEDLKAHAKKIEDEEQRAFDIPLDIRAIPDESDKDAWDAYWTAQELEWERLEKKHKERTAIERQKQIDAYDAQVDGIRLAAKDAMEDMIEKDKEVVSKLAKQALKSQQNDAQRIRKQAMRQLKK